VKNKLDGREYAVKKVPLKETDPDLCLKVKRKDRVSTSRPLLTCTLRVIWRYSHDAWLADFIFRET